MAVLQTAALPLCYVAITRILAQAGCPCNSDVRPAKTIPVYQGDLARRSLLYSLHALLDRYRSLYHLPASLIYIYASPRSRRSSASSWRRRASTSARAAASAVRASAAGLCFDSGTRFGFTTGLFFSQACSLLRQRSGCRFLAGTPHHCRVVADLRPMLVVAYHVVTHNSHPEPGYRRIHPPIRGKPLPHGAFPDQALVQ